MYICPHSQGRSIQYSLIRVFAGWQGWKRQGEQTRACLIVQCRIISPRWGKKWLLSRTHPTRREREKYQSSEQSFICLLSQGLPKHHILNYYTTCVQNIVHQVAKSYPGKRHNTPIPAAVGRTAATTLTTPLLHYTHSSLQQAKQCRPAGWLTPERKERKNSKDETPCTHTRRAGAAAAAVSTTALLTTGGRTHYPEWIITPLRRRLIKLKW